MASRKYDEIIKQPIERLAQTMSDITYIYNETKVPKAHYKQELAKIIELELDQVVDLRVLSVYVDTINKIKEDSPKLFLQALICVEQGIKIGTSGLRPNEHQALEVTALEYGQNSKGSFLKEDMIGLYKNILENGLLPEDETLDYEDDYEEENHHRSH